METKINHVEMEVKTQMIEKINMEIEAEVAKQNVGVNKKNPLKNKDNTSSVSLAPIYFMRIM